MPLLIVTVNGNSVTDRNIGSLRPVNREEKKYEVIELHARDERERSEWFLIVCTVLVNAIAIADSQWKFSNW